MKKDLFKNLPSEIITNILSRLPVQTIARSKCVCKPWLDCLETDYFVDSHLSKSVPSLAVMIQKLPSCCCKVVEFEDEHESFRLNPVTEFKFPKRATIIGAANGLLFLSRLIYSQDKFYICNPITRHYVEICGLKEEFIVSKGVYGFGVSRISGQYKVVRINPKSECRIYTLGTGSWRQIAVEAACPLLPLVMTDYDEIFSAYVDGHLYWIVEVTESSSLITCFDLETECFSSFDSPAPRGELSVLKDCLYFCECEDESIVVWLMKEYGVEKSWSKEYVIKFEVSSYRSNDVYPIKVFENGDMLMLGCQQFLIYYSNETKTIQDYGIIDEGCRFTCVCSMLFTPSFQKLKGLGMENVISL